MATRRFTTGEVGRYCGVHFRTVLRWIDAGKLKAHRLPGLRGEYRVCLPDLIAFLRAHQLPIPAELQDTARRVLVVEDQSEAAHVVAGMLRAAGFEIEIATDGLQAGILLQRFTPAVMTLNVREPADDGVQVLRSLRAMPSLQDLRVLVISALPREQLERALTEGADDVLQSPFDGVVLVKKVAALAGISS